jgi:hypothetical protein
MTDILAEVLDDKKDERIFYYFKKSLPIIIISTLIIILLMLLYNWREKEKIKNNQQTGDILVKAISLIDHDKSLTERSLENLITTSHNKISDLAAIEQVNIQINLGNQLKAKSLLKELINNKHYDELTTAYARLIWLSLIIDETNLSGPDIKETEEYLSYFNDDTKPFFGTANIIKAIWYINNNSRNSTEISGETSVETILKKIISTEHTTQIVKEQAKALLLNFQ